ncbi:MAG TPA: hypothetical protein VIA80_08525 [Hyphomonadaceae bacterium]|jgi:hypothetical protein
MNKYVVTAALAAGFSMIAGAAHAQSGHIGLNYGRADFGGGDADSYGIDGAVTVQTGGAWNVLLDGSFSDSSDTDVQTLTGTAHFVYRGMNTSWGGYVGLTDTDDTNAWVVGGEYAHHFTGSTLALGAGYGNVDDVDVDLMGLNGEFRMFANDNLRFDLGAGFAQADAGGGDADVMSFGAGVEYRFADSPFSIGASYTYVDIDDFGIDGNVIGITGRWNFGDSSLRERDRSGNTFGPLGGFGSALTLF